MTLRTTINHEAHEGHEDAMLKCGWRYDGAMILVAGGTGVLGSAIARRLLGAGHRVTILTRDTRRAGELQALGAQAVAADLRHSGSLRAACEGATHIITTANAFVERGDESIATVDIQGTRNLIDVARECDVRQFIFTSARLPEAYRSVDYFAAKYANEEYLRQSGIAWTILRPTAFMETWGAMMGDSLVKDGAVRIFGSGRNPINLVAVEDVATVAALTVDRADATNERVDIGGPENLTQVEIAEILERVTGRKGRRQRMPVSLMRLLAPLVAPFNPVFARQVRLGALSATIPQPFDPAPMLARYPVTLTRFEDWARQRYGRIAAAPSASAPSPLPPGLWPLASGLWPLASDLWPLTSGPWPLAPGLCYGR
jgi:uncharacterized protein YbjT (DUF2867 family)